MKLKLARDLKVFIASIVFSGVLILSGILTQSREVLGISLIISTFVIVMLQLFFKYSRFRTFKEMEERFPIFLRDLIESLRSGMPFHQAVVINSRVDYGKLSSEVRKMSHQISWGLPFDKVIDQFAERMRKSRRLHIAIKTIKESYMSGGDVVSTLESIADSLITLEESEKEKKALLSQYVVLMYAISFIFVGIVVALNRFLIPVFQTATIPGAENIGLINPCNVAGLGFANYICNIYSFVAQFLLGIKDPSSIGSYYTSLFFIMSLIVAFFSGLVAGQISENSVAAGIRHSLIMVIVVVGAFLLLINLNIIGV